MILKRLRPAQGIRFAWLPVPTSEGMVWLEWVHFEWIDHGFGGYTYRRWVPQKKYDEGARARRINDAILFSEQDYGVSAKHLGDLPQAIQDELERADRLDLPMSRRAFIGLRERHLSGAKAYATPPGDPRIFCRNYNPDGPTPCHYPHCLVGGMDNCEVCIGRDTDE